MDRRSLLKGALGTLSATVGAFALRSGVDARESVREGVPGRQVDALMSLATQGEAHYVASVDSTLVAGPDPDTYVYVGWNTEWSEAIVLAPEPFIGPDHRLAIPRAQFPEYDERHAIPGVVLASNPMRGASGYDELVQAIRGAYTACLQGGVLPPAMPTFTVAHSMWASEVRGYEDNDTWDDEGIAGYKETVAALPSVSRIIGHDLHPNGQWLVVYAEHAMGSSTAPLL